MTTLPDDGSVTIYRDPRTPPRQRKPRPKFWDGREYVCSYDYENPSGRLLFQKRRYRLDPEIWGRNKDFQILTPSPLPGRWFLGGPEGMERCMYRLPETLRAIDRGRDVHWTEGEDDADHLAAVGCAATTNAMGANKVNAYQAAWLVAARRVIVWMDKDKERPEVGAHDALMRVRALRSVGCDGEIKVVRALHPDDKDAADHVRRYEYSLQPARVRMAELRELAAGYTPATNRKLGYR